MKFKYAIVRNGILLDRAVTESGAEKTAARHIGAIVIASLFVAGCANPQHGGLIACDKDNCGKLPASAVQ